MSEDKKQGMKVIPTGERKCIWMDAGVVSYKLCTNQYQCSTCEGLFSAAAILFCLALSNRAKQNKIAAAENKPSQGNKKEIVAWMEEFRNFSADQRKCRYMLMGEVSYKICPNSFRCGDCTFDQMMQDRIQPAMVGELETFDKIAGFYLNENLYYFRNHTWLQLERNGKYRIGIDDFARRIIGNIKDIELPTIGKELDLEGYAWTIKHERGDIKFFSPISGIVDSINQAILDDTDLISKNPYSDGWLFTIDPKNITKSNKNFLNGSEAKAWMREESNLLNKTINADAGPTLHDGAIISENISENLSDDQWNELIKKHLFAL